MAEFIERTDTLNEGREKLNTAITDAEKARETSEVASATANEAHDTAEATRNEMQAIIREQTNGGDIVPEVVQARGGNDTLGNRLNLLDQELSTKAEIDYVDDNVSSIIQDLDQKASEIQILDNRLGSLDEQMTGLDMQVNPFDVPIPENDSKSAFIVEMNKKSVELGMDDSNFVNPHGMMNNSQITTARDMLIMGLHAIGYKDITKAWSKKKYNFRIEGPNARTLELETSLQESSLNNNYNVNGGKTGTLSAQNTQNLISIVNTKNSSDWFIGCVIKATPSRYTASRQLYDIANTVIHNKRGVEYHTSNITNGNFNDGLTGWTISNGSPFIDTENFYDFPQSLRVSRTSSSYVSRSFPLTRNNLYYISCMVKCDRYVSGTLGVQFTGTNPSTSIGVEGTTNGWEHKSAIVSADNSSGLLHAGAFTSANITGNVDMVNVINLTSAYGAGNEPSKSQMDANLWGDVEAEMAAVCQVPTVALTYNKDNLPILFEKNADQVGYPASMTKVMTAIVMMDNVTDLSKSVEITSSDITGGSGPVFQAGDIITLEDALHCLMLPSSNTAANLVSRIVGRKIYLNANT